MDKTLLISLQRLIRERPQRVPSNRRLRAFAEELGVGRLLGNHLHFTHRELDLIERECNRQVGGQASAVDLQAVDRMQAASELRDEKWAAGGVFEQLLNVARLGDLPIALKDGNELITPVGISLNLRPEQLDVSRLPAVLVVENGSLLTHWPQWVGLLPAECRHALIVYRGHGINQRLLQTLLLNLPESTAVYGFFDFDPAGVNMLQHLLALRPLTAVVPAGWPRLHQHPAIKRINKLEEFSKQREQLAYLAPENYFVQELAEIYNYLMAHELAITQEHLVTQAMDLETLSGNGEIQDFCNAHC